jgi:hypothetical protein
MASHAKISIFSQVRNRFSGSHTLAMLFREYLGIIPSSVSPKMTAGRIRRPQSKSFRLWKDSHFLLNDELFLPFCRPKSRLSEHWESPRGPLIRIPCGRTKFFFREIMKFLDGKNIFQYFDFQSIFFFPGYKNLKTMVPTGKAGSPQNHHFQT